THDVAYSTLLVERRRALHRTVGAAIEQLYPDRLAEQYEALAHHYYEGQEWEKALNYLEKAGDKSKDSYANQEALGYYARAREVCEKLGGGAMAAAVVVAQKRGLVNYTTGALDAAVNDFEAMQQMARACGDRGAEGTALGLKGVILVWLHDFPA